MYSSVAAQHNYTGSAETQSNQQDQQQTQDAEGEKQDNGRATQRHRPHRHPRRHQSFTTRLFKYIKQQFNPEKGEEEELDEFSVHATRHRPEELTKLARTTKFTRKEIQLIYRGFKQECFKNIFSQFFPQGDASQYAHYVFNTIKHNQTGKISFEDFLGILSRVSRGSVQEKLQWIFGLYDLNGDGLITKSEMLDVVTSIYEMLGRSTEPVVEENSAKEHVEKIFHLIDTNKDGVVTIDELVEWCSRDEQILQSLETLDTVL
ncbi:Kv channel-interacting protein 1-like [Zootermopsis nevadensis]|nr:Kv channel-interacting protein 1-like [Zootermopsis nevadensis]